MVSSAAGRETTAHRQRSEQAVAYRRLYKTAAWSKMRAHQLAVAPLCRMCDDAGRVTPATVVDHVRPHHGDPRRFFDPANLQSLCAPHHDSTKQSIERRGYDRAVGPDGWPTDPQHPANRCRG